MFPWRFYCNSVDVTIVQRGWQRIQGNQTCTSINNYCWRRSFRNHFVFSATRNAENVVVTWLLFPVVTIVQHIAIVWIYTNRISKQFHNFTFQKSISSSQVCRKCVNISGLFFLYFYCLIGFYILVFL